MALDTAAAWQNQPGEFQGPGGLLEFVIGLQSVHDRLGHGAASPQQEQQP